MCNQNIGSNKFDLNLSTNAFFTLVYSDFYEIPLPALRFEKVEETDSKKWKTTPTRNDAFQARQSQEAQRETDANDAQRKAESLARKRHAKEDSKTLQWQKHLL